MPEYYPLCMQNNDQWKIHCSNEFSNFHLRFHRFQPFPAPWSFKDESGSDRKDEIWQKIVQSGNQALKDNQELNSIIERQRLNQKLLSHGSNLQCFREVKMKLITPLSLGSAESSALETGILLHPLYGVPFIPASSIKGVFRNWLLSKLALKWNMPFLRMQDIEDFRKKGDQSPINIFESFLLLDQIHNKSAQEYKELDDKWLDLLGKISCDDVFDWRTVWADGHLYRYCFSPQKYSERPIFFDSYPVLENSNIFSLDIVNPHYSEYYTPDPPQPPADYLNPTPNKFLIVRKGVSFIFQFLCKNAEFTDQVLEEIISVLEDSGIGSKTSLEYGKFAKDG